MIRRPPRSTLFPSRRSSDLVHDIEGHDLRSLSRTALAGETARSDAGHEGAVDRKSTRLNSSHLVISYAVFCLKKKSSRPAPGAPQRHQYRRGDIAAQSASRP